MSTHTVALNGTIKNWTMDDGTEILFPEQEIIVNCERKLRGGAPVCCPIFGSMPGTEDYSGASLPQHGLVRLGDKYLIEQLARLDTEENKSTVMDFYFNVAGFPWKHTASVFTQMCPQENLLKHSINVERSSSCRNKKAMPLSVGFHPYFSTHGNPFRIINTETKEGAIESKDIPNDSPFFIPISYSSEPLRLRTTHGDLTISIPEGGEYTRFCIWTDAIDKYICIEPVFGKPKDDHELLDPGLNFSTKCAMKFFPK